MLGREDMQRFERYFGAEAQEACAQLLYEDYRLQRNPRGLESYPAYTASKEMFDATIANFRQRVLDELQHRIVEDR